MKKQTQASRYRHRLTFQSLTVGQDDYGGVTESWTDFTTVWGEVEYLSGRELWQAQQAHSEASGRVRIRYRSDILPTMQITHGTKCLHILSVLPGDNKNVELEILFKKELD